MAVGDIYMLPENSKMYHISILSMVKHIQNTRNDTMPDSMNIDLVFSSQQLNGKNNTTIEYMSDTTATM